MCIYKFRKLKVDFVNSFLYSKGNSFRGVTESAQNGQFYIS